MPADENKARVLWFLDEVFVRGNVEAARELVADDFVDHTPQPGQTPDIEGFIASLRENAAVFATAFPDPHIVVSDIVAEGETVAVRAAIEGTQVGPLWGLPPTGRTLPVTAMTFAHFQDGKVIELWQEQNVRLAWAAALHQERQRLARDLHDSVTQSLFSVGMLARAAQTQHEQGSVKLGPTLERVATLAQQALVEMRALLFELRADAIVEEGLIGALQKLTAAVQARSDLVVTLTAPAEARVSPLLTETVFRIVQEALSNAAKHAHAAAAQVTVELGEELRVTVEDDGGGFDPVAVRRTDTGGMGLRSMQERAEGARVTLTIDSAPGAGTRVILRAPLDR